jgi:alpha-tubulin suppressor-like RCC1 family protein
VAGQYHACAVVNGGVQCWGRNDEKQLGNAAVGGYSTVPVTVTGLGCDVSAACAGLHHTCALVNGNVRCWGSNDHGQLGVETVTGSTTDPVTIPNLTQIEAIACGKDHTCALRAGGVACWGDNSFSQLGQAGGPITGPLQVRNLGPGSGVTAIFANGANTCAIVSGGLKCWGDDTWGQLGNGVSGVSAFVPYQPPGLTTGVTSVSIGDGEFICAAVNGAVQCSGRTFYDIASQTWTEQHTFTAVSKPFDAGVRGLSSGYEYTCGILSGAAYCWGVGTVAHLSAGPNVLGLESGVESIATGDYFACALMANQVWCWGWDMDGQLGRGFVGAGGPPQPVVGLVAKPSCPYSHCIDGDLNGGETAIDCGGECRRCLLGQACNVDGDCQSNFCDSQSRQCVSAQCSDHHRDGDETDSDCGGPTCVACASGKACSSNFDCLSGFCGAHVCE